MRLTLIRHGQSVANAEGRLQGQMDYPLSEQGVQEAKALGKWMANVEIDTLYSSDLSRAYKTAIEIACHHDLKIFMKEELREFHIGPFQGLTRAEINERYPEYVGIDWRTAQLEGVEQIDAIQGRALGAVQSFLERHQGRHVVAVSHGGWISCLLMALLNIEWKGKGVFTLGNTSITTVDFHDPKHIIVVGVNERPHLVEYVKQKKQPKVG